MMIGVIMSKIPHYATSDSKIGFISSLVLLYTLHSGVSREVSSTKILLSAIILRCSAESIASLRVNISLSPTR